jgi:uncharacterized protein
MKRFYIYIFLFYSTSVLAESTTRNKTVLAGLDCHIHIHPGGGEMKYDGRRVKTALMGAGLKRACLISQAYQTGSNPACNNNSKPCKIDKAWVQQRNDWTAEQAKISKNFIGICSVDVRSTFAVEEIKRCFSIGHRGLKLHTVSNGVKLTNKKTWATVKKLAKTAAKLNMPILFHAHFQEKAEAVELLKLFKSTPEATFIAGHMLGKNFELLADYPLKNTYVETSMFPAYLLKKKERVVEVFRKFGIDRVVVGSDWPMMHPSEIVAFLRLYPFTESELKKIVIENGLRLFPPE